MKLICGIALVLPLLIQPTSSRADFALTGVGAMTCGELAQHYRKDPSQTEVMTWTQGFMSGANVASGNGQYHDLAAMTTKDQERSLRNYCDEHPMAEFLNAAMDLYFKLPLKKYAPASR